MSGTSKWVLTVLALAVLLLSGAWLLHLGMRSPSENSPPAEPIPVTAARLARRTFLLEGEYAARLEAVRDVAVTTKAGGTVVEDLFREGDGVAENQVLVRLEDDALRHSVSQAEASLDLAREHLRKTRSASRPELLRRLEAMVDESEAALGQAESDAARYDELYRQGAVPLSRKEAADLALASARSRARVARENLEEARTGAREEDLAAAEAAVRQAEAALLLAREDLENARVTSPLAGTVASKHAFEGDTLRPGDTVAGIVDLSAFKVTVGVSQADVVHFRRGDTVDVLTAFSSRTRKARVTDVGVKADGRTGSFPVLLEMENTTGAEEPPLRAGMDVTVRFTRERVADALVVPADALIRRQEGTIAFVVEGSLARQREVVTGPASEGEAVVTDGLSAGELLVVVGQQRLRDGDAVELAVEE